jgi:uncharacterized membrane protein YeiH
MGSGLWCILRPMTLLGFLDIAGVVVFAVSGALAAMRKELDLIGVLVLALVTAVGGGTLRDLLIDRPVFWVGDPRYVAAIVAASFATVLYVRFREPPDRALAIADALGLGFFAISGAKIADQAGLPGLIVVVMAVVTGVFGGIVRDVLSAEVPLVLRKNTLYATAAIVGASAYVVLADEWASVAAGVGMALIIGIRLAAITWNITLPVYRVRGR